MLKRAWRSLWGSPPVDHGNLYYVKLKTPQGCFYKIGYTSKKSIKQRFKASGDEGLIEKELLFVFRDDAYPLEQKLHRYFRSKLAFGRYSNNPCMPLCGRGQGELYRHDILGLDHELYKEEEDILQEAASDGGAGCTMILLILIGVVGIPLGGWGIPVLIIAVLIYMYSSSKNTQEKLDEAGIRSKQKLASRIQLIVDGLHKQHRRNVEMALKPPRP